jgi:peptidoglycan/xylan/chitin deacetylase (PgdA/CDA1 family)
LRNVKLLLFFVCKAAGLFHLAKWVTRNHLKILCYHGFSLADEADFRPKLFIKPEKFEQRLAAIQRYGFRVLPLNEAIERLYSRSLPKYAVVITGDDGFHSFHLLAVPFLQRYGYPATVYVTTYYVENPDPIFRLVVQYMFWKTRKHKLVLKNVSWSTYRVVDLSDPVQTEQALWDCINYGERECTEEQRCAICVELGGLLETSYKDIVQSRIFHLMTPNELRSLADSKIDVELHTHRHAFSSDDQVLAEREIADNRTALKQWLFAEAHHFCYPSGLWDERQWTWLDSMHVKSSATCVPGLNSDKTPRHALRRFLDGENIHQLEFEAAMSGFSDLLRGLRTSLYRFSGTPQRTLGDITP